MHAKIQIIFGRGGGGEAMDGSLRERKEGEETEAAGAAVAAAAGEGGPPFKENR